MPRQTQPTHLLPRLVAHADWGTDPRKRQMATAIREDSHYVAHAPEPVGDLTTFLDRLRERVGPGEAILLGFDFPIGLPAAYAARAEIDDFLEVLPLLGQGQWAEFYKVAEAPEQISLQRPFYREDAAPDDEAVRRVEGWILGEAA